MLPSSPEIPNDLSHISMNTVATHVAEEKIRGWIADFTNECRRSLKLPEHSFLTNIRCLRTICGQKIALFWESIERKLKIIIIIILALFKMTV